MLVCSRTSPLWRVARRGKHAPEGKGQAPPWPLNDPQPLISAERMAPGQLSQETGRHLSFWGSLVAFVLQVWPDTNSRPDLVTT